MSEIKYTNSSMGTSYNEVVGEYSDILYDKLDRLTEHLRLKIKGIGGIFTKLEDIGIETGTETIDKIVQNLPSKSILIHHKYGEHLDMYPQRTGLLVVIKGNDETRISFQYHNAIGMWIGFYDKLVSPNPLWSGWNEIVKTDKGILNVDKVVCRAFGDGKSTLMHNSLDGNGKNLGWSGSRFLQVCSQYGYFDKIELKEPLVVAPTIFRKELGGASIGMSYFDTELKKPIWFDGEKWVDSQGNTV